MNKIKYFCDECGAEFAAIPSDSLPCPICGCYCTYPDDAKGRAASVKDGLDYENTLIEWYGEA